MKIQSSIIVISGMLISGLCGYILNLIVPNEIGFADYLNFAVFWSALFLAISGLSGIQQEITRATVAVENNNQSKPFLKTGMLLVALVIPITIISMPLWVTGLFEKQTNNYSVAFVFGLFFYVMLAVGMGLFYGARAWIAVFISTVAEGITRLILVVSIINFPIFKSFLPWAVVLPIGIGLLSGLVFFVSQKKPEESFTLDVGYRRLLVNTAKTVIASIFMGIMISGFPVILELSSKHYSQVKLGLLIALITLVRAPFVVLIMALQSYLLSIFKASENPWLIIRKMFTWALIIGSFVSFIAAVLGEQITKLLFPETDFIPNRYFYICLIISSVAVSMLSILGSYLLSLNKHFAYMGGWGLGAFLTIFILIQNWDFDVKLNLALTIPAIASVFLILILIKSSMPKLVIEEYGS